MHVIWAMMAAIRQGINAVYFIRPMYNTSSAKIAPATGVPNTAAKPAAIPHINKIWSCCGGNLNSFPNCAAMLPPICTAVPSRPAEPPNKWVITVVNKISGVMPAGTPTPGWCISSIITLLPAALVFPNLLYSHQINMPANGKKKMSHKCCQRMLVACCSSHKKNATNAPMVIETGKIISVQLRSCFTIKSCCVKKLDFFIPTNSLPVIK